MAFNVKKKRPGGSVPFLVQRRAGGGMMKSCDNAIEGDLGVKGDLGVRSTLFTGALSDQLKQKSSPVKNKFCGYEVKSLSLTLSIFHEHFLLTPGFFPENEEISAPPPYSFLI